jgi:hypothetical protein
MSHQGQQQNTQPNPEAPPEFLFPMNPNKAFNFNLASAIMGNQFNLQSNSIFAYQEFDQFSSFVGNSKNTNSFESNINQTPQFDHLEHSSNNSSIMIDSTSKQDSSSYISNEEDFDFKDKINMASTPFNFYNQNKYSNNSANSYLRNPLNKEGKSYNKKTYQYQGPYSSFTNGISIGSNNSNKSSNFPGVKININSNSKRRKSGNTNGINIHNVSKNVNNSNNNGNNNNNLSSIHLEDDYILENIESCLKEQNKCRFLQDRLEEKKNDKEFTKKLFESMQGILVEIINHQFGNYVIQKFLEILIYQHNTVLITSFFQTIKDDLFKISINNYGTRVFQKSLEKFDEGMYEQIQTNELDEILKVLVVKHLFPLCFDKNGNHVFQKIIRIYPRNKNDFIYEQLNENCIEISKLKQGATILQTALKYTNNEQKDKLLKQIIEQIGSLVNDEYGNYIIQFLLQLNEEELNDRIYDYVKKNALSLSKKKFSSNVIDKCIMQEDDRATDLMQHLIDNKIIGEMILDQYGNYVVQKALKKTKGDMFMEIIKQVDNVLNKLKSSNIGRKIYDHLIKKYGEYLTIEK